MNQSDQRFMLKRRVFVGGLTALAGLSLTRPLHAAHPVPQPIPDQIAFDILRQGDSIGRHAISFQSDGETVDVKVAIDIEIKFAFFTIFAYRHRNHEVWRRGRLVSLRTETDDDGELFRVKVDASPAGLQVEGSSGSYLAPDTVIPTSYWNVQTIHQTQLLDTQRGRLLAVQIVRRGKERLGPALTARRYSMSGDLNLDIWYSDAGEWAKIAFEARGAEVSYAPVKGTSGGEALG